LIGIDRWFRRLPACIGRHAKRRSPLSSADLPSFASTTVSSTSGRRRSISRGSRTRSRARPQLTDIRQEVLRVECLKCFRIVEIQRLDAIKLFGPGSLWGAVADHLLETGCQHRTGPILDVRAPGPIISCLGARPFGGILGAVVGCQLEQEVVGERLQAEDAEDFVQKIDAGRAFGVGPRASLEVIDIAFASKRSRGVGFLLSLSCGRCGLG